MHTHITLKRRIEKANSPMSNALLCTTGESIMAFREEDPANTRKLDGTSQTHLNAHELFNIFTADIIKTNVVFTR